MSCLIALPKIRQEGQGYAMLKQVIEQRRRSLGYLEVGRVLPAPGRHMVGPFIFLDHMGPVELPAGLPRSADVRPHPHIGLSTVTYLFSGEIMHRDSVGSLQPIRPGEVNWMVAGRGITHSERFEKARAQSDFLHGIQAWIALPLGEEEAEPSFSHHGESALPVLRQGGVWMRVIAGCGFGLQSPVRTHSPLLYAHVRLAAGARLLLPAEYAECGVYLVGGALDCGGQSLAPGQLAVIDPGEEGPVASTDSELMLLAGDPVGQRFIDWNFVSSSVARLEKARADWRAGRFVLPPGDDQEFIPLPESAASPPAT
jgi:redox-sensitive bicupin YhaK (pirin superfamily)